MRFGLGTWVAVAAAVLMLSPIDARAQVKVGPEFRVNTYTTEFQDRASIAVEKDGDFVIVWRSYGQEGAGFGYGVFGQRYARDGAPRGAEFRVNTFTDYYQTLPKVAVNDGGNFVVVWQSSYQNGSLGIFGQRYDGTGAPAGAEFQANTDTAGYQYGAGVAVAANGGFVVVWTSTEGDGTGDFGIRGQRFGASGARLGAEFSVNTFTTGYQELANVSGAPDGRFAVVWESESQDGDSYGVFGQRYDATGARVGSEFQANTYTTGSQGDPVVTMIPDGRFIVGWQSVEGGAGREVRTQRFNANGTRAGAEFAVNTYTTGNQYVYGVAVDHQGNFVVTWDDFARDGDNYGVFGWRISSSNTRLGAEFQVNTYTTGYQAVSVLGSDEAGNFVVAWQDHSGHDGALRGVFAQRFIGDLIFKSGFDPTNP